MADHDDLEFNPFYKCLQVSIEVDIYYTGEIVIFSKH